MLIQGTVVDLSPTQLMLLALLKKVADLARECGMAGLGNTFRFLEFFVRVTRKRRKIGKSFFKLKTADF